MTLGKARDKMKKAAYAPADMRGQVLALQIVVPSSSFS
jgi:hypothetical protein